MNIYIHRLYFSLLVTCCLVNSASMRCLKHASQPCYGAASQVSSSSCLLTTAARSFVLRPQCSTFLLAGYETTANALGFAIYCLSSHPEAQERLLREVDAFGRDRTPCREDIASFPFMAAVLSESLRLYPPGALPSACQAQNMRVADQRRYSSAAMNCPARARGDRRSRPKDGSFSAPLHVSRATLLISDA